MLNFIERATIKNAAPLTRNADLSANIRQAFFEFFRPDKYFVMQSDETFIVIHLCDTFALIGIFGTGNQDTTIFRIF